MDTDWALRELKEFIDLTRLVQPPSGRGMVFLGDFASPVGQGPDIVASAEVVEKILDQVLPMWRQTIEDDGKKRWARHREAAIRAVTVIERQAELAERLGDPSPVIRASDLHPWIWSSAKSLWQSGHYREAVRIARVKVNAETQNKVGRRDVSEADLFKQCYSDDPAQPGKPRLRPHGDDGGRTAKSLRRGIAALAEGCFAAIRNPASHDELAELGQQEAVEQLAVISVLARLVDASSVDTS